MNQLTRFNILKRLYLGVLLVGVLLLVSGCASPGRSAATPTATPPAPATAASSPTPAASATPQPPPANPEPAAQPTAEPTATAIATATTPPPLAADGPLVLLYAPDGHLYRGTVETGLGRRLTTKPTALGRIPSYGPPLVSPDGRLLALNGDWGGATALDLATGQLIGPGRGRGMHKPSWSPDSQRLAYMAANGQLCVYHLDDAPADCIFRNDRLQELLWSPTSEVIAAAATDPLAEGSVVCCTGQVWLINAITGEASAVPVAYATGFEAAPNEVLAWLPDGTGLVIKKTADGRGAIYHTGDGSLTNFAAPILSVSPDGQMALHPSGAVSNVDGSARFALPGAAGCATFASLIYVWSPDGARLAAAWSCFTADGGSEPITPLTVSDTTTGAPLWQQPLAPDTWPVAWSPDGAYLLLQENATGLENYDQLADYALWQVAADGGTPELVAQGAVLLATIPSTPGRPMASISFSTTAAPTVAASPTPTATPTATRPTATPAPVITATPVPTPDIIGLDGTLVLYAALTAIRSNVDPNTYWDPHYGFKTWPPLPFVDPAVFDPLYGKRQNMGGDIQMFFFDRRAHASPDGRYILVPGLHSYPEYDVAGTGTWLLDLAAEEARLLLPDGVVATWSPASDAITYVDGGVLYTLSVAPGATPQPLLADDNLWTIYAKWSPAGDTIAVLSVTPPAETVPYDPRHFADLTLVPVDGGPPRRLNTLEVFGMEYVSEQIAWSPDGQYLLAMNRVYDMAGNLVSPEYDGAVDWLPGDNRLLLTGSNGIDVIIIAGEVLAHVDDRYSNTWALSHDGRRLAYVYGQWPDGLPGVAVYDLASDERWDAYAGGGSPIRWSADDSRIILGTYELQNGERPQIITVSAAPGGAEPQLLLDYAQLIEVVAWPLP